MEEDRPPLHQVTRTRRSPSARLGVGLACLALLSACVEMGAADFTLQAPSHDATELVIIIAYRGCSNGVQPERAEWVEVVETDQTIEIAVGVRLPFSLGGYTCEDPGGGTPVTVTLDEAVGDRQVFVRRGDEVLPVIVLRP